MASFLFLVAGVVIGLIAGWLIRGSRNGAARAADTATPIESTSSSTAATEPTGLVDPPADTTTAPITAPAADSAEAAQPTDEPAATALAEPEPAALAEPEPATALAEPEPTTLAEAEPADETLVVATIDETVVIEPIDETVAIATVVETVVIEPIDETVAIEPIDETVAIEPTSTPTLTEPADETIATEPITAPAVTEPIAAEPIAAEPIAAEPIAAEPDVPVPGAAETDEVTPIAAPIAVAVQEPDDLTKIAGIGPKMAMALATGGITTFSKLAESDLPTLRAAVTGAGMRLAPSLPTWPEQAKLLIGTKS